MRCSGKTAKPRTSAISAAKQDRRAETLPIASTTKEVVGSSDLTGDTTFHAFLWTRKTGMQDLGTLPGDVASNSISINDAGSVVGVSLDAKFNPRAFLWQKGKMTDLNTMIAGDSPLYLMTGCSINSRGEITGLGMTHSGEIHTYLATPAAGIVTGDSTLQGVIGRGGF